jgi:hypothetical protein
MVATNYDVWTKAGGKGVAIIETYKATVTDGIMNIDFTSKVDQLKISGIVILAAIQEPTSAPTVSVMPSKSPAPTRLTNTPSLSPSTSQLPSMSPSISTQPSTSPTVFVFKNIFINCGAGSFVDSVGRVW